MWKKLVLAVAMVAMTETAALAAEAPSKNHLKRIADAMGATDLKSLEYTGGGVGYAVGQSPNPAAPWPRYYLKSFTRSINFETSSLREELIRVQGENPPRGGGGQPITGEQRQVMLVSGNYAWNQPGKDTVPRLWEAPDRQHHIWITPQGVIKAAMAHNAAVKTQNKDGRKTTVISFADKGKMKVNAYVNEQDMVERVESWYGNPVAGDTLVETHYLDYREFSGLKFPGKIIQMQGGFPALDIMVRGVKPNAAVDIQVPDNVRSNPVMVKSEKAAEGVWYITGGSHHSVAIEMKDHVVVIEGPYGDERSVAVIAEIKKLMPAKPIRYLVNSHHHFDHSSGIRAYAAEGAAIVTHEINRPYYERAASARNLSPDRLAKSGKKPVFQAMGDNMVLTDGARTIELYQVGGNTHHDGLIMAYLRKEKILIEADAYTPGAPDAPPPATPNPFSVNLSDNIARLKIEVEQILPLHGRIVPFSELQKAIGKAPSN